MKLSSLTFGLLAFSLAATVSADSAVQTEARTNAMMLGKALKTELTTAMQAHGPIAAIMVCNLKAMPLADEVSAATGWNVGRTSLKIRNPANQPDAWEKSQLEQFDQRLAAGEPISQLEAVVETQNEGHTVQRFMKAIPTEQGCLACHGTALAEPVRAKLAELYPQDQAFGYQAGQLRGAFTLQRTLSN